MVAKAVKKTADADIEKIVTAFSEIIKESRETSSWKDIYEKIRREAKKNKIKTGRNEMRDILGIGAPAAKALEDTLPPRETLIAIGVYLNWGISRTNDILKQVGYSRLYTRSIDDLVWMLISKEGQCSKPKEKFERYRKILIEGMGTPYIRNKAEWVSFIEHEQSRYQKNHKKDYNATKGQVAIVAEKSWDQVKGCIQDRQTILKLACIWRWSVEKTSTILESVNELRLCPWFSDDKIVIDLLENDDIWNMVKRDGANFAFDDYNKGKKVEADYDKRSGKQWAVSKLSYYISSFVGKICSPPKLTKELVEVKHNRLYWPAFFEEYKKNYGFTDESIQKAWRCSDEVYDAFRTRPDRTGIIILACLAGWKTTAVERLMLLMGFDEIDHQDVADTIWATILNAGGSIDPIMDHTIYRELFRQKSSGVNSTTTATTGRGWATRVTDEQIYDLFSEDVDIERLNIGINEIKHIFFGAYQRLLEHIENIMDEKESLLDRTIENKKAEVGAGKREKALQELEQERCPKVNFLYALSIAYDLSIYETNRLLRKGGFPPLSLDAGGASAWMFLARIYWELKKGGASYYPEAKNEEYIEQIKVAESKLKEKLSDVGDFDELNYLEWMKKCFNTAKKMKIAESNGIAGIAWHYM